MQDAVSGARPGVTFREVGDADLPMLFAFRRDLALQSLLLTVPDAVDDDALHAWVARRKAEPGGLFRMVVDAAQGDTIGFVQVGQVHHRNRTGYLGVSLAENARGRGLGKATLRKLLDVSRDELGLNKGLSEVRTDNFPALVYNLQLGFRIVGTLKSHFIDAEGTAHDVFFLEHMLDRA